AAAAGSLSLLFRIRFYLVGRVPLPLAASRGTIHVRCLLSFSFIKTERGLISCLSCVRTSKRDGWEYQKKKQSSKKHKSYSKAHRNFQTSRKLQRKIISKKSEDKATNKNQINNKNHCAVNENKQVPLRSRWVFNIHFFKCTSFGGTIFSCRVS
ncbi:Hypothetical predicted protein, partial [Drosophila guanche]